LSSTNQNATHRSTQVKKQLMHHSYVHHPSYSIQYKSLGHLPNYKRLQMPPPSEKEFQLVLPFLFFSFLTMQQQQQQHTTSWFCRSYDDEGVDGGSSSSSWATVFLSILISAILLLVLYRNKWRERRSSSSSSSSPAKLTTTIATAPSTKKHIPGPPGLDHSKELSAAGSLTEYVSLLHKQYGSPIVQFYRSPGIKQPHNINEGTEL